MSYKILIPARLDSTRLPGKPLRDIAGKTLIQRVVEQAKKSSADLVCVATDSTLIIEHCNEIGVESILTKNTHKTGTDRLFEACELLKLYENDYEIIIATNQKCINLNLITAEGIKQINDYWIEKVKKKFLTRPLRTFVRFFQKILKKLLSLLIEI